MIETFDETRFATLATPWAELHARTRPRHPFTTHGWLSTWWRHFGAGRTMRIVAFREGERLRAAAPLDLSSKFGGRVLQLIGTGAVPTRGMGLADRVDFLYDPDDEEGLDVLCREVATDAGWDVAWLRALPSASPTVDRLSDALEPDTSTRRYERSISYVLELPPSWELFLDSKSSKWRKTFRSQINRAEKSGLVCERHFPCGAETLGQCWADVLHVARRSWKAGRGTGLLMHDDLIGFVRDASAAAAADGLLDLSIARIGSTPVAYELYFTTRDRIGAWDGAYAAEHAAASPGALLTGFLIRDSIGRGIPAFDFMRGDETYKARWGGTPQIEIDFVAWRRRPRAMAAAAAIRGKTLLKRFDRLESLADRLSGLATRRRGPA